MSATRLVLKPLCEADLPLFHSWMQSDEAFGIYDEPSRQSLEKMTADLGMPDQPRTWLVTLRDRPIGFCSSRFHKDNDWVAVIAVIITIPAQRGRGYGTQIHKDFCELLFREVTSIQKIEAYTDLENLAEQRVLEKAGFLQEELLRKLGVLRGDVRDMYLYGLLRQ